MKKNTQISANQVVTQYDKVLWHLQQHGNITSWEAFNTYRIMRLASIINLLRRRTDNNIKTEMLPHALASDKLFPKATNGKGSHAKYSLVGYAPIISQPSAKQPIISQPSVKQPNVVMHEETWTRMLLGLFRTKK